MNGNAEPHPLHLHRHSFKLVSLGKQKGSVILKDTVNISPNSTLEVDGIADNPGHTPFHRHQQLYMDFGFMQFATLDRPVSPPTFHRHRIAPECAKSN